MFNMIDYVKLYSYAYEVFINMADDFTKLKRNNESISDNFLDLIFGFENYLKNVYEDDVVHCAVNSALYAVCKEKECFDMWDLYSCAVT